LEDRPEIIADWLSPANAVTQAERLKAILPEQTWSKVKSSWFENLLTKNSDDTGLVKGQSVLNKLEKQKNLSNIFSPEEIKSMTNVFKAASLAQAKSGSGGGKMLIQLTQAGALLNLATFKKMPSGSYAVLIAPSVLSHLYTMPKFATWLAMGHTLPAGTPAATALATRILAESGKIYNAQLNEESKRKKIANYGSIQEYFNPITKTQPLQKAGNQ